nr:acetyl-CoA carboxylase biotin carboxyl carrier protein [Cyanidioschyzonaceae sp. 1]
MDSGSSHKKLKQFLPWLAQMMGEHNWQKIKLHSDELSLQLNLATKQEFIEKKPELESQLELDLVDIKAPMSGTYYAAASPNAAPFVKIGSHVKVGQTLCIIEAMKLMNTIESEHEGQIVQILVSNAQMVTAGQVMMKMKP